MIEVSLKLSYSDIQSIVDMMNWAWDNKWFEFSTSETVSTELLEEHLPELYKKVYTIAHQIFCAVYPNSEHLEGYGVYEIFCSDEICDYAAYSRTDYYMR